MHFEYYLSMSKGPGTCKTWYVGQVCCIIINRNKFNAFRILQLHLYDLVYLSNWLHNE